MQVECDTLLEISQGELQVCFIPHPNRRSEQRVMTLQSLGSPNRTVLRLLLGSPGTNSHSDVGATESHIVYYMGEGGGFPRVRAVVNQVNLESPVACPNTKDVPKGELTNLLVSLMQVQVSE